MVWRWQVFHLLYIVIVTLTTINGSSPVIHSPPKIEKQPSQREQLFQAAQIQEDSEKSFMLECEAIGTPEPTYCWMKNGEKFDHTLYDRRIQMTAPGTLIFTKPADTDEGLYQCYAENEHGIALSDTVYLRKSELNAFADEEFKKVYVEEGKPLTLECNPPTGYPAPTLFWIVQSNSGALRSINSSRLTVDPKGNLHFSNVTAEDSLEDSTHYACSATSVFRNEYKLGNRIDLRVEPSGATGDQTHPVLQQYVSEPNVDALRSKPLELYCIYGGSPLPEITWTKKGGDLQLNRVVYTNYGKTLKIRKVDFQDEGTYECTADNGVGSPLTHTMAVTVKAAPYWIKSPNDTNAAEEETVSFECSANGVPEPTLQWFINGVPLRDAEPNRRRKLDGNILSIENLEKSDTSVFQCNASNIHGYAFANFYLNVLALPPTIIQRPEAVSMAVVNSSVTLHCHVFGAPTPTVKWAKDGQPLEGPRYEVMPVGHLQIKDVIKSDEGDYTCYVSNKLGDKEAMGRLEIKDKTRITQFSNNSEVAAGKSATFNCEASADSSLKLDIEWLFNDNPIDFDRDPRIVPTKKSLTITKTMESDSGTYTCIAKTSLDEDRASATLTVQDVPNAPKVTGVVCEGLTALVRWQPRGDRHSPITGYTIQFNTSFTPDIWEDAFARVPPPDTQFKVSMTPWANYTFRVIAVNKIGPSLPSGPSSNCTTPPDVPYRNPDNVRGRGIRKDNLVISWTPMPMIEQNAPGFFYKVFWKRDDIASAKWEINEIKDWEQSEMVIEDQPTFKPYRIKVEAHNEKGQAHVSATEIIGYSGEDEPRDAPKNFKLQEVKDARSAIFSWDPVSPESVRGHFKGYRIQTWTQEDGEDRLQEVTVQANVTQALVNIFRPFSRNLVRVRAFNEMYNGPASDVIEFNTPEGTPGPVANFDAIPMGSSALYLIWKKPLEPNGILTGYKIYYERVNGTELSEKKERSPPINDPRETRTKLAGLHPDTRYRVTIHATTSKGKGAPYFIETKTNQQAESAPDVPDLLWSRLPDVNGKGGIRVTWVPAVDGHPGSHFFVQYRKKDETVWESTAMEENQDTVTIRGLDLGSLYELRVIAVDGAFQTPSKIEEIETGGLAMPAPESSNNIATAAWFIGMMCAIALLLLLLIIVCLIKRNRGGKYSVHEKEAAQGRDPDYPEEAGFNEYNKPVENQNPPRGSRTSLNSSIKGPESETDSMVEYGEGENSKFTEDGSFIGQYGAKKKKEEDTTSPSALATFV